MSVQKRLIKEFKTLFPKGLLDNSVDKYHPENNRWEIKLPDGTEWAVSITAKYYGTEWFFHVYNNFINMENQTAATGWASLVKYGTFTNNKVNFLITGTKKDFPTMEEEIFNFQRDIIFTILPSFWEDEGAVYYSYQGTEIFIGNYNDAEDVVEQLNNIYYQDMTKDWTELIPKFNQNKID